MNDPTPPTLVDFDRVTDAPLSRHYSNSDYRLSRSRPNVDWDNLTKPPAKDHCAECFMVQHETRGKSEPRMQPRWRRTIPGGPQLLLCSRHAEAWRERDRADVPAKAAARKGR